MLSGEMAISLNAPILSTGGASVRVAGGVPLPRLRVAYPYLFLSRREKPRTTRCGVIVTLRLVFCRPDNNIGLLKFTLKVPRELRKVNMVSRFNGVMHSARNAAE